MLFAYRPLVVALLWKYQTPNKGTTIQGPKVCGLRTLRGEAFWSFQHFGPECSNLLLPFFPVVGDTPAQHTAGLCNVILISGDPFAIDIVIPVCCRPCCCCACRLTLLLLLLRCCLLLPLLLLLFLLHLLLLLGLVVGVGVIGVVAAAACCCCLLLLLKGS